MIKALVGILLACTVGGACYVGYRVHRFFKVVNKACKQIGEEMNKGANHFFKSLGRWGQ